MSGRGRTAAGGGIPQASDPAGAAVPTLITDPTSGLIIGQADGAGGTVSLGADEVNTPFGPITANTQIKSGPAKLVSIVCNVSGTLTVRNGRHTTGTAVPGLTSVAMTAGQVPLSFGAPIDLVNGFGLDVSGGGSFSGLMR